MTSNDVSRPAHSMQYSDPYCLKMKDIESLVLGPTLRLPHFIGQNGQEVLFTTTFSNVCR